MPTSSCVTVPIRDRERAGTLRLPSGAATGVILFVHGSGHGTADEFSRYTTRLAALGVASVVIDKVMDGYGPLRRDYDRLAGDAIEALEWIQDTYDLPVAMLGYSEGSWVAVKAAARRPDLVDRLILCSAPLVPPREQNAHRWLTGAPAHQHVLRRLRYLIGWLLLSIADYGRVEIKEELRNVASPILLVLGENDSTVDVPRAVSIFDDIRPQDDSTVVPGATHALPADGDWLSRVAAFVSA